ncbi:glycosyltransferase [Cyclobacterium plantarum]|uniref:Rhamnosyltransferase n=1 Tax=Cyclobacterium plantarum TaxID=2716263 RepID=A0ABX0H362_9BACT|nr:glycosyltransferase [Cyclobacterium plantarum]NHE56241.1 hypothetical protein [Cyclobacterium plantarum]
MREIFKHFVFTRVNLGFKDLIGRGNVKLFNLQSWLDYRFNIFYATCLPSIMSQTNQKFIWYIFLDIETPQKYINELHSIIKGHLNIVVLLKEGSFSNVLEHARNSILDLGVESFNYLITTRIDSDDMIHKEYINEIQKRFNFQKYAAINFNKGFVYDLRFKLLGTAINKSNPFISVIERVDPLNSFKTVFHVEHSKFIFIKERILIESGERMWAMTIHDLNIDTKFYGNPKLFSTLPKINGFHFKFINNAPPKLKLKFKKLFYKKKLKKVVPFFLNQIKLHV